MMRKRSQILEIIHTAFENNDYPGDEYLIGSLEGGEPLDEVNPFIGQNDWRSISPGLLDSHPGALNFFSEAGLRFFLPAYLVADMRDQLKIADPVFPLVHGFSNLSIPQEIRSRVYIRKTSRDAFINPKRYGALTFYDYSRYRLSIFSREEAQAIVAYLENKRGNDPGGLEAEQIEAALISFWYGRAQKAPDAQSIHAHLQDEAKYLDQLFNHPNFDL
ncbi:MAG: DUF6714 family protein [Anaerolineales bacterium]|jgi:hypothetical protein